MPSSNGPTVVHLGVIRTVAVAGALALLATGCRGTPVLSGSNLTPLTTAPASASGSPAGGPGAAAPDGSPAPVQAPVPGAGDDNLVTLDGKARSVETTATITGLSSVHLSGTPTLTASGEVTDHAGHLLGSGTLRADGSDVTVAGTNVQLASRLRVQPGGVTASSGSVGLAFSGSATIAAGRITFQPPAPPAPTTAAGSAPTAPVSTTVPPPVAVAGPVTIRSSGVQIAGADLRWVDAPADLGVSSSEADLSWAGSGSITTSHGPIQSTYLGVRAQQLQATLHRSSSAVDVHGTGLALQAYANGVPQLRVPARIDILSTGATTGFLGYRHAFVWTPRNLGNTYDMAILSIHPGNAAAGGVHIGLLPMPAMFGGEPHASVGGDTAGLKGGGAIDSLIARHGDDKRSIGYDAARGVPLVLIIQGNFDPITVTVTTY